MRKDDEYNKYPLYNAVFAIQALCGEKDKEEQDTATRLTAFNSP